MTARESLEKWIRHGYAVDLPAGTDAATLAGALLHQLDMDGFLIVRKGNQGHGIKPPTGSLGVDPV